MRNQLKLPCLRKENLLLKRFGSSEGVLKCLDVVQICVKGRNGVKVYLEALCIPEICTALKFSPLTEIKNVFSYLNSVVVNPTTENGEVNVLVGLDYYFSLISGKLIRGPPGCPVAIESLLCWIICGRNKSVSKVRNDAVTNLSYLDSSDVVDDSSLKDELKKFSEIESFPSGEINDLVQDNFNETIYFNGLRYVICLPFRSDVELVPDNYEISLRCLPHLLKKLKNDPDLYQEYRRILDSYEKEGIIESV